ncbi:MAG: SPW repeat domain-containing protein [Janthinobacterium lividum]
MEKPISRRQHAFTDYSYAPLVASAPHLVGFTDEKAATTLCHVLSSTVLVSSLFTRAEWGPIPVMPYKAHLVIDTLGGLTALTAPWAFGFAKNKRVRNTFLVIGVFGLIAGLLSKPEEMSKQDRY